MIEAELFGYVRGAFTDARASRSGLFETADGGSLFLDEIGALPVELQGKLLTVIEERTYYRVGGKEYFDTIKRFIHETLQRKNEAAL